jgi:hypothetical protein
MTIDHNNVPIASKNMMLYAHPLAVTGIAFLIVGLLSIMQPFIPQGITSLILTVVGFVFLGWGILAHNGGPIIAGGILGGIGAGIFFAEQVFPQSSKAGIIALGLGIGFVLIYLISQLFTQRGQWWTIIPGGILIVASTIRLTAGISIDLFDLFLVFLGVYFVWEVYRQPRKLSSVKE